MTRPCTRSQMLSSQNGSSTQMAACVMIQYCHQHLGSENEFALGGTSSTLPSSLLLHPYSPFSRSRRAKAPVQGLTSIHLQEMASSTLISVVSTLIPDPSCFSPVVPSPFPAPSFQGIKGQKNLLSQNLCHNNLFRSFCIYIRLKYDGCTLPVTITLA